MEILTSAVAGTLESSDIMVTVSPNTDLSLEVELTSPVDQQFGGQIRKMILNTAQTMGLKSAKIIAVDKGALDCTILARTAAAICRACGREHYPWGGGKE